MTKPDPTDLEAALFELHVASAPNGLSDDIMRRVRSEQRWLGLPAREWAFVAVSMGVFSLGVQAVISFSTSLIR